MIFQLIDDHSRYAVASHVAAGETAEGAIAVVDKAIAAHGVPQRLLSDNGIALNPSRHGYVGRLVAHVSVLIVEAITGKPYKPTTQGKNETLPPDPVPLPRQAAAGRHARGAAGSGRRVRPHLQHRTSHQSLPGRVTPRPAWEATPKAEAPRRKPDRPQFTRPVVRVKTMTSADTFTLKQVTYLVGGQHAFEEVLVITDGDKIIVTDPLGEILIEHPTRTRRGIRGNGRPRGPRPKTPETSPKS